MPRVTPEELIKISERAKAAIHLRQGVCRARILVHMGTCGIAAGARAVMTALIQEMEARSIADVALITSSCAGLCSREPMLTVEMREEPPVKYVDVTPEKAREILGKHVLGGEVATEFALSVGSERML